MALYFFFGLDVLKPGEKILFGLGSFFDWWNWIRNFGLIYRVKQLQNDRKYAIFQNWLDALPKMETHEPNVYPTIFGGISQGFWSPF